MLFSIYSGFMVLLWVSLSVYLIIHCRKVAFLKDVNVTGSPEPSVAIIIAVKDEEAELEAALKSVCELDYAKVRILVINDRSTDDTPVILQRMAKENPALTIITINELPEGWLGKNHALYQGYLASSEDWMLFTDADIQFNKEALKKAVAYADQRKLDHLAVFPQVTSKSWLFRSVMNTFAIMLDIRQQPWAVSNPASDASIGIGAFNLVKRSAYEKAGTHSVISLRPDDDLKLGERIKAAGLSQGVAYGHNEISLQWYTSLSEFIKGLMKNTFSVSNYHLPTAVSMALATFMVFVLPVPLLLLSGGRGPGLALVIILFQILLMRFKKGSEGKFWHAFFIPFAGAVMVYIILKSAFKTLQAGGIYWRNSFYALSELKKQE